MGAINLPVVLLVLLALALIGCGGVATDEPSAEPAAIVRVLLVVGETNALGSDAADAPLSAPDAAVPFFRADLSEAGTTGNLGPLNVAGDGTFSHELRLAQRLVEAGESVAVVKIVQAGSGIASWLPNSGASPGSRAYAVLAEALDVLPGLYPDGTSFRFTWVWDQGETDGRAASPASAARWGADFAAVRSELELVVGQRLDPYVVRASSGLIAGEQAERVSEPSRLIETWDLPVLPDGLRRTGAAQNAIGERLADSVLSGGS